MPQESKVVRSDRFTLSVTGFALVTLVLLIIFLGTSAQANANVSGMNPRQNAPLKQTRHTGTHAMFLTGDTDFDYAANMRIHQKLALDMSVAQFKYGKSARLRAQAARMMAHQKNEIALLDRWIATKTEIKSKSALASK